jgi:hypothetical protein
MATWKKVIVSGSQAELAAVTSSIALKVASNQQIGTTQATTFLTGSFTGSFKGDGTGLTGLSSANNATITLTASTGLSGGGDFTTNQSGDETITFSVDSGSFLPFISGSVFSTVSGDVTINAAGVAAIGSEVIVNADIADSTIDLTAKVTGTLPVANGGTGITSLGTGVATFLGTPSSTNLAGAVTGETGTGALVFATSPTLVTPNIGAATGTSLVLSGDLTVNGDLVTLNTTNVSIEDQFITIASGSQSATDGGIIVSKQADGAGFAFGYDTATTRWVLDQDLAVNATGIVADAYIATVEVSTSVPSDDPVYGGSSNGYGNIHVKTDTGDIFIYV